jgi:hypothetical protein
MLTWRLATPLTSPWTTSQSSTGPSGAKAYSLTTGLRHAPTIAARVSTGSALAVAAQDALVQAARELLDTGMQGFWKRALRSVRTVKDALRDS